MFRYYQDAAAGGTAFLHQGGQVYEVNQLISVYELPQDLVQARAGVSLNGMGAIGANGTYLRTGVVHLFSDSNTGFKLILGA